MASEIDGEPLTPSQLLNYAELLVEAGNETTRNAISGGLLAFSEHPGEWERLRRQPELLPSAVEEILRWVSPIIHFIRTATEDCEVRGEQIAAGDKVALFYASANRDEDVFDDPFSFRIDRQPNHHLAFGSGARLLHGGQPGPGRTRDALPPPPRAPRVLRAHGAGRAPQLGRQRRDQAPEPPLPPHLRPAAGTDRREQGNSSVDTAAFGIAFANVGPFVDPERASGLAVAAEAAGFESIWTADHVVVTAGYRSTYPYDPSGRLPSGEDAPFPDHSSG